MKNLKYFSIILFSIMPALYGELSTTDIVPKIPTPDFYGDSDYGTPKVMYFTNKTESPVWIYLIRPSLFTSELTQWTKETDWASETFEKTEEKMQADTEYRGYVAPDQRFGIQITGKNPKEIIILRENVKRPSKDKLKIKKYNKKQVFYDRYLDKNFKKVNEFEIFDGPNGGLFLQAKEIEEEQEEEQSSLSETLGEGEAIIKDITSKFGY